MKIIRISKVLLYFALIYTLSFGCSQTDDLINLNDEVAIDVDGNTYKTVTINDQIWMAENLKTTRYRNGDLIDIGPNPPNIYPNFYDLSKDSLPKYQWPCNGEEDQVSKGGRFYTWYAAMDSRSICPVGWHLPSDEEWQSLKTFLIAHDFGRYTKKGQRKENADIGIALASEPEYNWAGPAHSWEFNSDEINTNFTEHNTTGFSGLPAGCFYGRFMQPGYMAIWRSTSPRNAWSLNCVGTSLDSGAIWSNWEGVYRTLPMDPYSGYSVRCLKNGVDADQDSIQSGIVSLTISNPTVLIRSAKFYVEINSDGGSSITKRGLCWSTSPNPTIDIPTKTINGSGKGQFQSEITGLSASTTYFVRAFATNNGGTTYSREISFITKDGVIGLTTKGATSVTSSSATLETSIINEDNVDILSKGICWNIDSNPTVELTTKTVEGTGSGNFTSLISGLDPSKKYYARAYAVSNVGTFYGNEIQFKTGISDPIKDIDGNVYHYVKIGNLTWMTENLKTTRYRDGSFIPYVHDTTTWKSLNTGACTIYNYDIKNADIYGRLYNWYAVIDSRNIAPEGWHVAKIWEWQSLINYLSGVEKIMETGTKHWLYETEVSNESGFTALPGGYCNENGGFAKLRTMGSWWGVQYGNPFVYIAYFRLYSVGYPYIYYDINEENVYNNEGRIGYGMSIRCVKDN